MHYQFVVHEIETVRLRLERMLYHFGNCKRRQIF